MAIDPRMAHIPQYTPPQPPRDFSGVLIGGVILSTVIGFYVGGYIGVLILSPITYLVCRWLRRGR